MFAARTRGFTLIEVLIAFLIFGIIGVVSSQLLSQTIRSHGNLSDHGARLTDVHRAMQVVQRDLMQLSQRAIRDEYGDAKQHILIGTDGAIEFTRVGWRNPLDLPRSEVQRVGYLLQDRELVRGYWNVLDRAQDSEPRYQTLLRDVERVEFFALDADGNEHTYWPQPGARFSLVGIIMRVELKPFGVVERVWEVPVASAS